jgi:hypothetical protein
MVTIKGVGVMLKKVCRCNLIKKIINDVDDAKKVQYIKKALKSLRRYLGQDKSMVTDPWRVEQVICVCILKNEGNNCVYNKII